MGRISKVVERWVAEKWDIQPSLKWKDDDTSATLKLNRIIDCGECDFYLEINEAKDFLGMYLYGPAEIPDKKLLLSMDAIALINSDLFLGNVELLRVEKSWFRYRAGIDVEDGALSTTMLSNMWSSAESVMNQYYPALMSICYSGIAPSLAIAQARGEDADESPFDQNLADALAAKPVLEEGAFQSPVLDACATELKQAISIKADNDAWKLVGHGIVVVHDDMGRACEMLRNVATTAGMNFVRIESEDVFDIPLKRINPFGNAAPIVVYLEPGDWMTKSLDRGAEDSYSIKIVAFREALIDQMEAFDCEFPIIYATSAYKLDDVSPMLRKHDRFDRYFHIPQLTPEQSGREFVALFDPENCDESITCHLGKVGELLADEFDNTHLRRLVARNALRLVKREGRVLTFVDLVAMSIHGLGDSDEADKGTENSWRHTAVHEAGHAAIALIDSEGKNVPEYSSIISQRSSKGVVMESIEYNFAKGDLHTYADFLHKVHISLAGRAAEEVVYGPGGISNGSRTDLKTCSKMASRAFAQWGFAPLMNDVESSASNLAVIIGEPTPSEFAHNETLTREFLATEYKRVVDMLIRHRGLLDAIADQLLQNSVLDQRELAALYLVQCVPK